MNFKASEDKNILEHREGLAGLTLFISIIGAFTFFAAFGGLAKPGDPLTPKLFVGGGLVFLVGILIGCWRIAVTIDKGKKEFRYWMGFFFKPVKVNAVPFSDYDIIRIKLIERRDVEEVIRWYRVFMEGKNDSVKTQMLFASRKKDEALAKAKELSDFTGIKCTDDTPT